MTDPAHHKLVKATRTHQAMIQAVSDAAAKLADDREYQQAEDDWQKQPEAADAGSGE